MRRLPVVSSLAALLFIGFAHPAAAQFRTLARHLPEGANTLVLFNVEALLESPLAQKEQWRQDYENMYSSGVLMVPPQTNLLAIASQLDVELMQPHWQVAVMDLSYEPSMMETTVRYGGNVDEVNGQEAAVLPNNTYVVKFGKTIVGTMFPADRQKATRWVETAYSDSNRKPLGPYLTEAESFAERSNQPTPIIMAIDLQHVLSPTRIRHQLESAASLQGKEVDLDQLAKILASVRGATLGLNVTDHVFGGLKVDFDEDVTLMKDFAKPLLLEVLSNHGAMIQEFNDWDVQVGGKEILLRGSLYKSGFQRICSVLDAPADLRPVKQSNQQGDGSSDASVVGQTTLQYFKLLEQLIGDLQQQKETTETTTAGLEALWYKRYASKIDAMPTLNVDPEMVKFGSQVSATLRQAQAAMQGVGVSRASQFANMQGQQVYDYEDAAVAGAAVGPRGGVAAGGAYEYRSAYNPWASLRADGQEIAQIDMSANIKGYQAANHLMDEVNEAMGNMKRRMTEKYKINF